MYAYISGNVKYIEEDSVVVDNHGMGYRIMTSDINRNAVAVGDEITMFTHLNVREDDMSLFGFLTRDELHCFKLLIGVSGIGPKGALSILSALSLDDLRIAIASEDYKAISKANGVGAKTAQRVIIELKDKLKLEDLSFMPDNEADLPNNVINDIMTETALALTSLGYSNVDAIRAIKKVDGYSDMTVEQLLKETLKKLI